MKTFKPEAVMGVELIEALQTYARNRDNQKTVKWDKQKDLDLCFSKWLNHGVNPRSVEACAGTFWLSEEGRQVIKVHAVQHNMKPEFLTK